MEQDNPAAPSTDEVAPLDTVEKLDNTSAVDDTNDSPEDVQTVLSSELIEPLAASDVLELDYDEDIPTRVDGHRREQRRETFPPARGETGDVFYLTEERRPSLTLTAEDHVNISDVLRAPPLPKLQAQLPPVHPPPMRDTIPPAGSRSSTASSIAPLALSSDDEEPGQVRAARIPGRGVYGSVVVVLAAAAAIIALWPSGKATESLETVQQMAQPAAAGVVNTAETKIYAPDPVIHQLDVVEVVSDAPLVAGVEEKASRPADKGIRPAPPTNPSEEVVIDDAAQLDGTVVFPTEETPSADPQPLMPPEPPSADPLPFDRGAAAAAMNAAAGMAQACRTEGMPQSSARVSVTFAPSGRVTTAVVDGNRLSGSAEGGCIARTFRTLRVDPFSGPPVTVHKSFQF
jgi:hypothetical protein